MRCRPPSRGPHQVRVKVRAASLNAADWHMMRGDPRIARLSIGLRRPRARIRGRDVAGVVDAVGAGVTRFAPGDEVYGDLGDTCGAFAEQVCASEEHLDRIPEGVSFEQAAAVALAGRTAYLCVVEHGRVTTGSRVLVIGASGGVGTFAVQLADHLGAEVDRGVQHPQPRAGPRDGRRPRRRLHARPARGRGAVRRRHRPRRHALAPGPPRADLAVRQLWCCQGAAARGAGSCSDLSD